MFCERKKNVMPHCWIPISIWTFLFQDPREFLYGEVRGGHQEGRRSQHQGPEPGQQVLHQQQRPAAAAAAAAPSKPDQPDATGIRCKPGQDEERLLCQHPDLEQWGWQHQPGETWSSWQSCLTFGGLNLTVGFVTWPVNVIFEWFLYIHFLDQMRSKRIKFQIHFTI